MSLHDYQKKREFTKTPEPEGTQKEATGPLSFVIQKHEASRLHYDFRLELNGVLKSWAIPKGPSLNPGNKRLAMMVEDHPVDYADFEGIIPQGNYGAGTVMVWDKGVYSPLSPVKREEAQIILTKQLKEGDIKFVLLGSKLKGEFALVKTSGKEENAWLLIKKRDDYATSKEILSKDHSILTERSMNEIKNQAVKKEEVWFSKPKSLNMEDIPKKNMPHHIKPMLAMSRDKPFDKTEWLFEMKYDGYRTIAEIEKKNVKLYSRNNISFNEKFEPIAQSLKHFPGDVVLDGEIAAVDIKGYPHFQWLQNYPNKKKGELLYFVFDVLYYEGRDLTHLPLYRRKELLKQLLPPLPHIVYGDYIQETGIAMFQQVQKLGIEGIMAKNSQSIYKQGTRTNDWLKIKTVKQQEIIIAGFTRPKDGRQYFGALIAGIKKLGKLSYIGHVGGGFDDKNLKHIYDALQPLIQKECPFEEVPKTNTEVSWVKPKLHALVAFSNLTTEGQMRHPIFLELRNDNDTKKTQEHYFDKDPIQKRSEELQIGKQTVILTNLEKVFWPQQNYTKKDLITYYREVAPVILPHLKYRPQSLLRYPNGINGESFYQKDASTLTVDWIEKVLIHSDSGKKDIPYLLCQNEASLMYLINLGCIDLNPWSSRVGYLNNPDYLIIDLDPEDTPFTTVIKVAQTTREVLEQFEIPSYPKTSGAKGMHIYIPLEAKYSYEQSRKLAELLCVQIHSKIPDITSLKRSPKERQNLVYLDYLQNIRGQTLASVYSVRAQPDATVSTPLLWSEVTSALHPSQFTIKNVPERIQKHGDLYKDLLGKGINIKILLTKMRYIL